MFILYDGGVILQECGYIFFYLSMQILSLLNTSCLKILNAIR